MKEADKVAQVEAILGRPMKETEKRIFNLFKKDTSYEFSKDGFGNLKVTLKEKTDEPTIHTGE